MQAPTRERGKRLSEERKGRGWSPRELAGVSTSYLDLEWKVNADRRRHNTVSDRDIAWSLAIQRSVYSKINRLGRAHAVFVMKTKWEST